MTDNERKDVATPLGVQGDPNELVESSFSSDAQKVMIPRRLVAVDRLVWLKKQIEEQVELHFDEQMTIPLGPKATAACSAFIDFLDGPGGGFVTEDRSGFVPVPEKEVAGLALSVDGTEDV